MRKLIATLLEQMLKPIDRVHSIVLLIAVSLIASLILKNMYPILITIIIYIIPIATPVIAILSGTSVYIIRVDRIYKVNMGSKEHLEY